MTPDEMRKIFGLGMPEPKKQKTKPLTVLLLVAYALLVQPFVSLLVAWTISVEWRWFLASQYGAGPSLMSWFGATFIVGMLIGISIASIPRNPEAKEPGGAIAMSLGVGVGALIVLGVAWVYRSLIWGMP